MSSGSKKIRRRWEWRGDEWVAVVCFVRVYSTVKVLSLYITLRGVERHGRVQKKKLFVFKIARRRLARKCSDI